MNSAPPPLSPCSVCETPLDPNGTCPRCRAPEDWNDQIEALDFVMRRLRDWQQTGQLTDRQLQTLTEQIEKRKADMQAASNARQVFPREADFPPRDECWSCHGYLYKSASHCSDCGAPITNPAVKSLRYWRFLVNELNRYEETGWLTLRQAHDFVADTQERVDALQKKLERERAVMVIPVEEDASPPPRPKRPRRTAEVVEEPETPRRSVLEVLLDPHTIQWLLAGGGTLIVLGLIIWLASMELFQSAGFVAVLLGLGNAILIGGGFALIQYTRFQNGGRALTLLACLVMPLNLWFYHTHDIMTLDRNLWIAALG